MNTAYWDLFWTTGMPEAWLMSRGGAGPIQAPDSALLEERQVLSGPLAGPQLRSDNFPGGPMRLY